MQESKLLDVLKKLKTPETNEEELLNVFTSNLNVMFLKNEDTLFKIDDIGDKFFIILKGKVEVSKPVRKKKLMNQLEFMDYLIDLRNNDDKYLILQTIRSNYEYMCFHSYEDFTTFENVYLKMNLLEHINLNTYAFNQFKNIKKNKAIAKDKTKDGNEINLDSILEIFKKAKKVPGDYCLDIRYMKSLTNIELRHYIKENINISNYEEDIYEKYKFVFIMDKELKMFIIYEYVLLSTLSEGQLFGDFALDSVKKRRTATVKAVENCALGWISNEVYEKYIFQENQKIRVKDMQFLNTNVIFNPIKPYQFEKLYFCEFQPKTYLRGETLIKQGSEANKIILIKEGKVEVYFHASLIDILEFLKEIIQKGKDFKLYTEEEKELLLNEVINDKLLQIKSQEFINSIKKTKSFLIVTLTENDMIGLEPIFFSMNNFYSVVAKTDKCQAFEIEKEKLDIIFNHHEEVRIEFKNIVGKKLNAFIKRFLTVKSSLEDLFTSKNQYNCKLEKMVIKNMQKKKLLSKQKVPININFQNTAFSLVPKIQKNKFMKDEGNCIKNKKIYKTLSDENIRNNTSDEYLLSGTESNFVNFKNYKYEQQSENYSNYNISRKNKVYGNSELEERAKNLNISKIKNIFNTENYTFDKSKDTSNEHNFLPLIKSKKKIVIVENLNKTKSSRHEDTSGIDSENFSDYNKKDYSFKNITNSSLFSKSKEKFNFTYKKIECPPLKAEASNTEGEQNVIDTINNPNAQSVKDEELIIKLDKNEENSNKLLKGKKKKKKLNDEIFLSQFQSNVIIRSLPKIKLKKGMLPSNRKINFLPKLFNMENNNNHQNTQPSETFKYFIANKCNDFRKNSIALSEKWKNSFQTIPLKKNINLSKSKEESSTREEIIPETNYINNSNSKLKTFILTDKKKKFESSDSLYRMDNIKSSEHKNLSNILITNSQRLNSNKKKIPYTIYDCKLADFSKTYFTTIDNVDNTNIITKTSCDFNKISTDIYEKLFNNQSNFKRGSENLNKGQMKVIFDKMFNRNTKEDFNKSINSNFNTINIFANTSLYNTNNTFRNKNNFVDNQYEATESYFFPNINSNKLKAKSFHHKTNILNTSSSNYNYRNFTERNITTFMSPKENSKVSFENKISNENNLENKTNGNNKLNHLFYGEVSSIKTDTGINFTVTDSKKFPKHSKKLHNQTKPGALFEYYISYLNRDLKRNLFQNTIKNKSPSHKKAKMKVDFKSIKIEHLSKDKSCEKNKSNSKEKKKVFSEIKNKNNAQMTKKSLQYLKKL